MSNATWEAISPVPPNAPEPIFFHSKFGKPESVYRYHTRDGQLCGYTCRFVRADGLKELRPYSYGNLNGKACWAWKAVAAPRPIFRAHAVDQRPNDVVLIVEGEKAAEAAEKLLTSFVVTTTMFGAQAPHKSDWSLLCGRRVVIWPDNDDAGSAFAKAVRTLAQNAGVLSICTVEVPSEFPPKWDLADPLPLGFSLTDVERLISEAQRATPNASPGSADPCDSSSNGVKYPFRLVDSQVQYELRDKDDNADWLPVCSYLAVTALTRNSESNDWGRLINLRDSDGLLHSWAMPMRMLAGDGAEYRERLLEMGLIVEPGRGMRDLLQKYIATCAPDSRLWCVSRIGWHLSDSAFVLPDQVFGSTSLVLQRETASDSVFRIKGNLVDWQNSIGKYAEGNSRLILWLCAAFAAPLLQIVGTEGGGFHLDGPSSRGKSTASMVAGSVWGGGGINGYLTQWRVTVNGLEGVAANHCDALLCLDEIGQAQPDAVGEAAYLLANGSGKTRANRAGAARRAAEWRVVGRQ